MSGYLVGQPFVLYCDDIVTADGTPANPETISLTLRFADGAVVVHPVGDLTHVGIGSYSFIGVGAPGQEGEAVWRWEHTNPTNAHEGTITIAPSSVLTGDAQVPITGPCSPWTDFDEVAARGPLPAAITAAVSVEEAVQQAIESASDVMYQLGGRRWPGVCDATVQVLTSQQRVLPLAEFGTVAWRPMDTWGIGHWFEGEGFWPFGCWGGGKIIELPGPILHVNAIRESGVTLDPTTYKTVDWRQLVRVDGGVWPAFGLITDAVPALEIDYAYGQAPPAIGRMAAASLARELILAFAGDESCRLDRRIKTLVREGTVEEMGLGLPGISESLRDGNTGIPEVDLFVHTHNPSHLKRSARLLGGSRRRTQASRRT